MANRVSSTACQISVAHTRVQAAYAERGVCSSAQECASCGMCSLSLSLSLSQVQMSEKRRLRPHAYRSNRSDRAPPPPPKRRSDSTPQMPTPASDPPQTSAGRRSGHSRRPPWASGQLPLARVRLGAGTRPPAGRKRDRRRGPPRRDGRVLGIGIGGIV